MIDEQTIAEAGRRIAAAAPEGSRVILFGSQARGEADAKSDVDFLVIEPRVESISAESTRLLEALDGMRVPADVVVFDRTTAERWGRVAGTVVARALKEGRVLAEADSEPVGSVLLGKARADLSAAQILIASEDPDEEVIGFHVQQAVEKALKSILANWNREVPHTHNLGYLVELLKDDPIELPQALDRPQWLTPWGVAFRYATASDTFEYDRGLEAATAAIGLAERVLASG